MQHRRNSYIPKEQLAIAFMLATRKLNAEVERRRDAALAFFSRWCRRDSAINCSGMFGARVAFTLVSTSLVSLFFRLHSTVRLQLAASLDLQDGPQLLHVRISDLRFLDWQAPC